MKKLKKVLSGALCALIAMLAPGIGAYQAAAQDFAGREVPSGIAMPLVPTSIEAQIQNIGMDSAQNFLDASFNKGENNLMEVLPQNPAKRVVNVSQSAEIKSTLKLPATKRLGTAIQKTAKSFAVKLKKIHAAVSQKVSDSISDKISGFTRLFDGSKLAPAYAKTRASSFNFAARKKFVLGNYLSQAADSTSNGSKVETVPAPWRDNGSFMDRIRQIPGVETTDLTGPRIMTIGINANYPVATIEAEVRAKVPELSSVFVKIVYVDAANPGKILAANDLSSTDAPSGAKKTVSANVQNSSFRKIADSAAFGMLVIAASQLSLLPAIGVILGSGISWAMTPKGQPVFFRMLFGAAIGLGIAAMFAPAVAHAAIFGAAGLGVMKVVSQSPGLNNSSDGGASLPSSIPSDAQKAAAAQLSIGGLIFGLNEGYLNGAKDGYPAKFTPSAVELLRQINSAPPPAGDQLAAVSLEVSNKFLLRFAKIVDQINDRTGGNKAEFVKALHDVLLDPLTKQVVLKEGGFKTYQEALDAINSVLSQAEAGGTVAAGAYVGLSPEKGAAKIRELKLTQIRVVPLYGLIKVSMTVPVTEDLLQQVLQGVFQVAYKGDAPNFIWLEGPRK